MSSNGSCQSRGELSSALPASLSFVSVFRLRLKSRSRCKSLSNPLYAIALLGFIVRFAGSNLLAFVLTSTHHAHDSTVQRLNVYDLGSRVTIHDSLLTGELYSTPRFRLLRLQLRLRRQHCSIWLWIDCGSNDFMIASTDRKRNTFIQYLNLPLDTTTPLDTSYLLLELAICSQFCFQITPCS